MGAGLRRFQAGETVAIREVLHGKVWTRRPVQVVEDSDEQFVSYLAPGTLIDYPIGVQHGETCFAMWLSGEWDLLHKEFQAPGMLRIAPVGQPFEIFGWSGEERGVTSWYVNFQQPLRRTPSGFDTMDETLDLIVSADCTTWSRRDEDELELAVAMGVYTRADARRLYEICATVEAALGQGLPPWDVARWGNWSPTA